MSEQEREIQKMIYPHYQVQEERQCGCNAKDCRKCIPANDYEGLIVLDDEQEDDDDVDV